MVLRTPGPGSPTGSGQDLEHPRHQVGEVTGDEPGPMAERAGAAVDVGGESGGIERRHTTGQEGADHAGQYVAGAG